MITVIIINIIAIFFAFLESNGNSKYGLKISFIIIFFFLAFRYNYGNDYTSYFDFFESIKSSSIIEFYESTDSRVEFGWIIINKIFSSVGFFALVAVLALFNCIVYYHFIKKYVPVKYYWFGVFLYTFSPYIMLIQLSAMRQTIAILLFVLAIDFIISRRMYWYFVFIIIASFFHTSALILLPLYFLKDLNKKFSKSSIFIFPILFVLLLAMRGFTKDSITSIISSSYFDQYEGYLNIEPAGIGFMVPFSFGIMIIILIRTRFQNVKLRPLYMIALIYTLFTPIIYLFPMTNRLSFYFQIVNISVFPLILSLGKRSAFKLIFLGVMIIFTLYMFFVFFNSNTWIDFYGVYKTIFSSEKFY